MPRQSKQRQHVERQSPASVRIRRTREANSQRAARSRCPYGAYVRPTSIQATARCSNDARIRHLSTGDTPRRLYGTRMRRTSTGDTLQCAFDARVRQTRSEPHASVRIRRMFVTNPHQGTRFSAYPASIYDKPASKGVLRCGFVTNVRQTRSWKPDPVRICRTHATRTSCTLTETHPSSPESFRRLVVCPDDLDVDHRRWGCS